MSERGASAAALLTSTSISPACSARRRTDSMSFRSAAMNSARPPCASIAATVCAPRWVSRPVMTTLAPRRANSLAVSCPIPAVAPVTSTRWSCSFIALPLFDVYAECGCGSGQQLPDVWGPIHAVAVSGSECCAVLADEVSEGQRGAAAGRGEGGGVGVHPRDRGVVRHRPGVGREVLDHRVVDQASGVHGRGLQLTGPLLRGDVLVADVAAGFLADDVGDLLLGEPLKARRIGDWADWRKSAVRARRSRTGRRRRWR